MTHYRAQPEDDAVLIVLCAVRDGQFGKSALNEVIDLWVAGQIGRTDSIRGAVEALEKIGALARNEHVGATHALQNIARLVDEAGHTEHEGPVPCPDCGSRKTTTAPVMVHLPACPRLDEDVWKMRQQLRGAVEERDRLGKLVEPKEWLGWEQIDSIYDEARLLRKERDEARSRLREAIDLLRDAHDRDRIDGSMPSIDWYKRVDAYLNPQTPRGAVAR